MMVKNVTLSYEDLHSSFSHLNHCLKYLFVIQLIVFHVEWGDYDEYFESI